MALTVQEILQGYNIQGQVLGASTICGNAGVRVSNDGGGDQNFFLAIPDCVPVSNSTVQSCVVNVDAGSGNISCAVYANSAGAPTGSPLCQSANTVSSVGLNTLSLSGCGTLTAGSTYWIAVSTNNNAIKFVRTGDSSATDKYQTGTYPTFPTGGSWLTLGVFSYQFYLNITDTGGATPTPSPTHSPTPI